MVSSKQPKRYQLLALKESVILIWYLMNMGGQPYFRDNIVDWTVVSVSLFSPFPSTVILYVYRQQSWLALASASGATIVSWN